MGDAFDRDRLGAFRTLGERAERSSALPGLLYSDPTVYEEERVRIFHRRWQLVAHESELAETGAFVATEIAGEPIFVARQADGSVGGFYNVCQHRAHQLVTGRGQVRAKIVCPYHAWTYNLDGSLAAARFTKAVPDFDPGEFGLEPVRTETALGFVFVNLDPDARSLAKTHGDMFADMAETLPWLGDVSVWAQEGGTSGWEGEVLEANWKVLAENCLECYHCGPAHPDLVDLIDMKTYACVAHGPWLKSQGQLKKADSTAYAVDPDEPVQETIFWHMWPNVEFSLLPGQRSLSGFRFGPKTAEQTVTHSIVLTIPGEDIPEERLNYRWNVLWPEDKAICVSVHRGLKSKGYRQGRFVTDPVRGDISEHAVHYFQTRYAEEMDL